MVEKQKAGNGAEKQQQPGICSWQDVLAGEHAAINLRRPHLPILPARDSEKADFGNRGQFNTIGLALSGGGIRSAAFCLGAVQALASHQIFEKVDYLSTVSGGGYAGAAITSRLTKTKKMPFSGPQTVANP